MSASSTFIWGDSHAVSRRKPGSALRQRAGAAPGRLRDHAGRMPGGAWPKRRRQEHALEVPDGRAACIARPRAVGRLRDIGLAVAPALGRGAGLRAAGPRDIFRADGRREYRGSGAGAWHLRYAGSGRDHRAVSGLEADVASTRWRIVRRTAAAARDRARFGYGAEPS